MGDHGDPRGIVGRGFQLARPSIDYGQNFFRSDRTDASHMERWIPGTLDFQRKHGDSRSDECWDTVSPETRGLEQG